eukprot:177730-Prorocentrum_lima.AAC.1
MQVDSVAILAQAILAQGRLARIASFVGGWGSPGLMATKDAGRGGSSAYRADTVLMGPKKPYWRCKC